MACAATIEVFTQEFLAYRPILERSVMRSLGGSPDEVADILQTVWMKGALAVESTGITHYKSWLWRTARNLVLDRHRDARRSPFERTRKERDDERPRREPVDHRPGPYDQLAQAREHRRLVEAVKRLPAAQQEVLIRRYVDLEPFEDIAARTGTPIETFRSRMFRAFAVLRVALDDAKQAA